MIEEQIPAALGGERLDRVVALLIGCSRSEAAAVVAAGGATVDGAVETTGKLRLAPGQRVTVDPSLVPQPAEVLADPEVSFTVVYADDDLVVVDKPAGLVVHPAAGHAGATLANGLLARFPEIAGVGEPGRPGIVHRLDVGTSGLMAVARSERAYPLLVEALAARDVGREYTALVWGHPENAHGVVDAPIGRDHRDPLRMAVVVDGKPARTRYRVVELFDEATPSALLACTLETGRTHQIRVHLAAIGHPVVGDATYGGARDAIATTRPFLHARALELDHPITREHLRFESALPEDLQSVLSARRR